MKIELRKVDPPFDPNEYFGPGERKIYVDGVEWGRIYISSRGRIGRHISFGDIFRNQLTEKSPYREKRMNTISIFCLPPNRAAVLREPYKTIDQHALDKIEELIKSGIFRDPDTVRAEALAKTKEREEKRRTAQEKEEQAFRERACLALGAAANESTIKEVVEAMRWAQTQ